MLDRLLQPVHSAQFLAAAMLAVLFIQSGLDKVLDFAGNLAWLQGHFAKSPLRGQVKAMLVTVTVTELLAGFVSAAGALVIAFDGRTAVALWGAQLAGLNIVMLFLGQRMAKDYAGAASLVPYFILSAGAIVLMAM